MVKFEICKLNRYQVCSCVIRRYTYSWVRWIDDFQILRVVCQMSWIILGRSQFHWKLVAENSRTSCATLEWLEVHIPLWQNRIIDTPNQLRMLRWSGLCQCRSVFLLAYSLEIIWRPHFSLLFLIFFASFKRKLERNCLLAVQNVLISGCAKTTFLPNAIFSLGFPQTTAPDCNRLINTVLIKM